MHDKEKGIRFAIDCPKCWQDLFKEIHGWVWIVVAAALVGGAVWALSFFRDRSDASSRPPVKEVVKPVIHDGPAMIEPSGNSSKKTGKE